MDQSQNLSSSRTSPRGVSRRSIVKGAVWATPVIATSVALPAYAASEVVYAIVFASPAPPTTCREDVPLLIQVSDSATGSPAGGAIPVTVSLPDGLVWLDGSADGRLLTTDAAGQVAVTVRTPTMAGDFRVLATLASGISATSDVTVSPSGYATSLNATKGTRDIYEAVPTDIRAIGRDTFLTTTNDVWYRNTLVASGVRSVAAQSRTDQTVWISYVSGAGKATSVNTSTMATSTYSSVPASVVAIGRDIFRNSNGDVYAGNTLIVRNTTGAYADTSNYRIVTVMSSARGAESYNTTNLGSITSGNFSAVPAGSVPCGRDMFLTASGDVYFGAQKSLTKVAQIKAETISGSRRIVSWVDSDGVAHTGNAGTGQGATVTSIVNYPMIPKFATVLGRDAFLDHTGTLWVGGEKIAEAVHTAAAETNPANDDIWATFTDVATLC